MPTVRGRSSKGRARKSFRKSARHKSFRKSMKRSSPRRKSLNKSGRSNLKPSKEHRKLSRRKGDCPYRGTSLLQGLPNDVIEHIKSLIVYRASDAPEEVITEFNRILRCRKFDTTGRDRRDEYPTNDITGSVTLFGEARMNVSSIDMYEASNQYTQKLREKKNPLTLTDSSKFATTIVESFNESKEMARPLINRFSIPYDESNELILWHGTTNANLDGLLNSMPIPNKGAYGHGFYLTPDHGKADQYSARNEENETFKCLIGYRCIPGTMSVNPHLDRASQIDAESEQYTSLITQNKDGCPIRFKEVIVRDLSRLSIFAVIKYDLYYEQVGLPSPSSVS